MAHDWGHLFRQGLGSLAGIGGGGILGPVYDPAGFGGGAPPGGGNGGGGPVPMEAMADCSEYARCGRNRYLTYDCKDGTFKPRSRRRRRRLLTGRDISDLAALQAIAGKGAALQMAIATAVRR